MAWLKCSGCWKMTYREASTCSICSGNKNKKDYEKIKLRNYVRKTDYMKETIRITWLSKEEIERFMKKWFIHSEIQKGKYVDWVFQPKNLVKCVYNFNTK